MGAADAEGTGTPAKRQDDVTALLTIKKGSRFIPVLLLVLAAFAFIIHGLSSTASREALTDRFRTACSSVRDAATAIELGKSATATQVQKEKAEAARKQLFDANGKMREFTPLARNCTEPNGAAVEALAVEFRDKTNMATSNELRSFNAQEVGGWDGIVVVIAAAIKEYLDLLWAALLQYWKAALLLITTAALYALLPGLAGLIYRRAFWTWFGIGFAALLAINSVAASLSRLIGKSVVKGAPAVSTATGPAADPALVSLAADLTAILLVQAAVLLLAFRVRRYTAKPPLVAALIAPRHYNRILFWLLIVVTVSTVVDIFGSREFWNRLWTALPFSDTMEWLNVLVFGLPFVYAVLKVSETWSGKARKNIVVCLDGTSNTPDQYDMGFLAQTNVFKLFKMVKADKRGAFAPTERFDATLCKIDGDRQVALYYTGIGNKFDNDPVFGTLAQATGMGATGIIERAYLDVMRVWRPGDRLFIVGFSRGAASARILARTIAERGAPRSIWTLRMFGRHWTLLPSRHKAKVPIDVLGCWDTVGSFGIAKTIAGINFQQLNLLHDMSIPENVEKAYHMVALDEERQEFEPTLMEPDPIRPERIVEVWFPGTHAGVGGGWATDRLSDVPLDFLLRRISSGYSADGMTTPGDDSWGVLLSAVNGLASTAKEAPADVFRLHPDPRGQLRVWISKIYNYRPRRLPLHAVISETVFERMKTSEPVYAPQALFDLNDALDAKRDLIAAKVDKLDETKSLAEGERQSILEYTDKLRLMRGAQDWSRSTQEARAPVPPDVLANA